jgi:hypothetical protein
MDLHYNAFLNWLKTHNVTQAEFEDELRNDHTSVDNFLRKLQNCVDRDLLFDDLWLSHSNFFTFSGSLKGRSFWTSIFQSSYLTTRQVLQPHYGSPNVLTNEEIFTKFLKHCRKYSWIKDRLLHRELDPVPVRDPFSHIINCAWYDDTRGLVLRTKWYRLVDTFKLTGHVDISKIFK